MGFPLIRKDLKFEENPISGKVLFWYFSRRQLYLVNNCNSSCSKEVCWMDISIYRLKDINKPVQSVELVLVKAGRLSLDQLNNFLATDFPQFNRLLEGPHSIQVNHLQTGTFHVDTFFFQ